MQTMQTINRLMKAVDSWLDIESLGAIWDHVLQDYGLVSD